VQVGNPAGTTNSFQSGIIGAGLDYQPKSSALAPNQPTTIHVYPDFSNLKPEVSSKVRSRFNFRISRRNG